MSDPRVEASGPVFVRAPHAPDSFLVLDGAPPIVRAPHGLFKGASVAARVGEATGLRVNLLRRLAYRRLPDAEDGTIRMEGAFELEVLGGDPSAHDWRPADALRPALGDFGREALDAVLAPATPRRPDWQRPGWFAAAEAWLDARLHEAGLARTGDPVLAHNWQISVLLSVPTTGGTVYLKGVPSFFAREVPLTAWLAEHFPGVGPGVLAAAPERGLIALRDAGPEPEGARADPAALAEETLRRLARLQRASAGRADELRGLGLIDRGPRVLAAHVRELVADLPSDLSDEDARVLRAALPRVEALLARLDALGLPPVLVHGDLHLGNVVTGAGGPVLLDWSDGALGHPFLDARPTYLLQAEDGEVSPEVEERLLAAYADEWADLVPREAALEALRAAPLLGEFHSAVAYARFILPGVEDRSEWAHSLTWHLGPAARTLAEHEGSAVL